MRKSQCASAGTLKVFICVAAVLSSDFSQAKCPQERRKVEPVHFQFSYAGTSASPIGKCGKQTMGGYSPNHKQSMPSASKFDFRFAYLDAFGGPTARNPKSWMDAFNTAFGRAEIKNVTRVAKSYGCKLDPYNKPSDRSRWLGEEGMRCLMGQLKDLQKKGVTDFEIDNAGWLKGQYSDQAQFVEKFTKIMEEEGVCDLNLVMKNLKPTELSNVISKMESGQINSRLISNFAISEEFQKSSWTKMQQVLDKAPFPMTLATSGNTYKYAVSKSAKNSKCGPAALTARNSPAKVPQEIPQEVAQDAPEEVEEFEEPSVPAPFRATKAQRIPAGQRARTLQTQTEASSYPQWALDAFQVSR